MCNEDFNNPNYVFTYDEEVPSCLKWKNPKSRHLVGKAAGTFNKKRKEWYTQFRGQPCSNHRIIWEMFNGPLGKYDTILFKNNNTEEPELSNLTLYKGDEKNWQRPYLENHEWDEVLEYKDGNLYWTDNFWSGGFLHKIAHWKGKKIEGHKDKDGYLVAKLGGYHSYTPRLHRVIYEYHYGKIPDGMQIDHINGVVDDNRIENLRLVSPETNARNVKMNSRNRTGVTGVSKRKNCYRAIWRYQKKYYEAYYSISKYGKEEAFRLACEKRKEMVEWMNSIYGEKGYTEDHGVRE